MKRIGVIGPTNAALVESTVGLRKGALESASKRFGEFLAENSFGVASVPARGVGLWVMESYLAAGGAEALAFAPHAEGQPGEYVEKIRRNASAAHRVIDDITWGEEPFELAKACDRIVVLGISCGTFIEMVATKWMNGPPVLVLSPLVSSIPAEVLAEIDATFFESMRELTEAVGRLTDVAG